MEWAKLESHFKVLTVVGVIALLFLASWLMALVPDAWAPWRWFWLGEVESYR